MKWVNESEQSDVTKGVLFWRNLQTSVYAALIAALVPLSGSNISGSWNATFPNAHKVVLLIVAAIGSRRRHCPQNTFGCSRTSVLSCLSTKLPHGKTSLIPREGLRPQHAHRCSQLLRAGTEQGTRWETSWRSGRPRTWQTWCLPDVLSCLCFRKNNQYSRQRPCNRS